MLQCLDDILLHCITEDELFCKLRELFSISREHRIKLHARKCQFYVTNISWCGGVISEEGIRMGPKRMVSQMQMPAPNAGDELQQVLWALNWMRMSIRQYNGLVFPLSTVLDEVLSLPGSHTKRAAAKVKLTDITWNSSHIQCFEAVKRALANSHTLAHSDPAKTLCLFTDASDEHWSGVLWQIHVGDLDAAFLTQRHEALAFLSGYFHSSSARWSTPEKEVFAIVQSFTHLDYMLLLPEGSKLLRFLWSLQTTRTCSTSLTLCLSISVFRSMC